MLVQARTLGPIEHTLRNCTRGGRLLLVHAAPLPGYTSPPAAVLANACPSLPALVYCRLVPNNFSALGGILQWKESVDATHGLGRLDLRSVVVVERGASAWAGPHAFTLKCSWEDSLFALVLVASAAEDVERWVCGLTAAAALVPIGIR